MEKKIKQFFQKKKVEAKFKLAGPGHKLSESGNSSKTSTESRNDIVVRRSGLTEECKIAAEAALARLSLKRDNPAFNTSYAYIQAQVKKELESQQSPPSSSKAEDTLQSKQPSQTEIDLPKNYVVSGVYFKCPMLNDDILPRDEWRANIRAFLNDMKQVDPAGAAALTLQTCNSNREKVELCQETIIKYLQNLIDFPGEEKYYKIRMSNKAFVERVLPLDGALDILHAVGYREQMLPFEDGEAEFLVFNKDNIASMDYIQTVLEQVRDAQVIPLELDRNLQVLMPSQAAGRVELPPSFYAISPEELKREQQLRAEVMEKSQMLRTKAMREKEELKEMRKFKFALIRIRFPDGILLQGTFSVYERYSEIYEYVRENLEFSDLPFVLVTPTGQKLSIQEDGNKTLVDLRLVPTMVLNFAWHSSVADKIRNSPNKDVYLKPEVMVLVKDM